MEKAGSYLRANMIILLISIAHFQRLSAAKNDARVLRQGAASTFLASNSSVSPLYSRRSEWPMIT